MVGVLVCFVCPSSDGKTNKCYSGKFDENQEHSLIGIAMASTG